LSPIGQTACLECDLLLPTPHLEEGQRATCPRCKHHLAALPKDGLARALALALAAVLFLLLSLWFPFLSFAVGGFENMMTLPQTAIELAVNGRELLALLVAGFIIFIPATTLAAILAMLVPLVRGKNAPWLVGTARLVSQLSPWSMAEVFVIGVIVSLVKLMSLATVVLGFSFWAYAAFTVCLTATLAGLDRVFLWDAIERVQSE
jgi:paraquat-inducible protein A